MQYGILFSLAYAYGFAADVTVSHDTAAQYAFKLAQRLRQPVALFLKPLQTRVSIIHIRDIILNLGESQEKNAFK